MGSFKKALFAWRRTLTCSKGNQELFKIVKVFKFSGSKKVAEVINTATGQPMRIRMKGNWRDFEGIIYHKESGRLLATISRKADLGYLLFDNQTYVLEMGTQQ